MFLDSEAFWPKFSSSGTSSSNVTELPPIDPITVGLPNLPLPCSRGFPIIHPLGEGPIFPEIDNWPPMQHTLPPPSLPKGWTYDLVPNEAPKNIKSTISSKKIIMVKHQTQLPSHFVRVVRNCAPQSFKEAMPSPKASSWMFAIQKEFSRI
ncbi:hypothetical protein O181_062017 [Austropuccinia psidii MF-1]|uniref:Uncharacterized protein n=1 Tax=Austropuccinia psidii MF-1 TaxID=1389203 RepID=A0A9Q3ERI0_9BASI|nr:hypothetical protein [Austropuccinia psidii MF-1]